MNRSIDIAVEDRLSETILRVLLASAKGRPKIGRSWPIKKGYQKLEGPSGYGYIRKNLKAFNAVAAERPFVALIDADNRPCPSETIAHWLENEEQHQNLVVRVAIREIEAWLLADRHGLSSFLAVSESWIPLNTARIRDPKRYISRLAARSKRKVIREDLARAPGTRSKTGPYFTQSLQFFAKDQWDIDAACAHSDSLRRARHALDRL